MATDTRFLTPEQAAAVEAAQQSSQKLQKLIDMGLGNVDIGAIAGADNSKPETIAPQPTTKPISQPSVTTGTSEAQVQLDKDMLDLAGQREDVIAKMNERIEASRAQSIEAAKAQAQQARVAQQDVNERTLAAIRTNEIRRGGFRYAPEITQGIVASEERAALQRIEAINAQERALIAQANAAADEKQFGLLSERMADIRQMEKEKQNAYIKLQEEQLKQQQLIDEEEQKRLRDQNILEAVKQGYTDAASIAAYLGDAAPSFEDIGNALEVIFATPGQQEELSGVSSDFRTFRNLYDAKQLPSDIQALPQGEAFIQWTQQLGAAGRAPAVEQSNEIDALARQYNIERNLSSIPEKQRGAVLARAREFAKEDVRDDVYTFITGGTLDVQQILNGIRDLYPEFSRIELQSEIDLVLQAIKDFDAEAGDQSAFYERVFQAPTGSMEGKEFLVQESDNEPREPFISPSPSDQLTIR